MTDWQLIYESSEGFHMGWSVINKSGYIAPFIDNIPSQLLSEQATRITIDYIPTPHPHSGDSLPVVTVRVYKAEIS